MVIIAGFIAPQRRAPDGTVLLFAIVGQRGTGHVGGVAGTDRGRQHKVDFAGFVVGSCVFVRLTCSL